MIVGTSALSLVLSMLNILWAAGADVSHPGAGNFTNPSICGVVASMDSTSMRYAAQISVQTGGRRCETIVDLKSLMKVDKLHALVVRVADAIQPLFLQYYDKNGDWPQQLLYYRCGAACGAQHLIISVQRRRRRNSACFCD